MIPAAPQSSQDNSQRDWKVRDLCDPLGLSRRAVVELAAQADSLYQVYPLTQGNKKRWIEAPAVPLKRVQRRLLSSLLYQLEPSPCAHGFVTGRSIVSNAREHVGEDWVVTVDLKDFFPSVRASAVDQALEPLISDAEARQLVVSLTTRLGRLPQGAPTSPHLANLAARPLDDELIAIADEGAWRYSRYADDLSFSGSSDPRDLLSRIRNAVRKHAFRLADRKTQIRSRHQRQVVTGLVVNQRVRVPKPARRRLRAMHHRAMHDFSVTADDPRMQVVAGHLAFAAFVDPATHQHECLQLRQLLRSPDSSLVSDPEEDHSAD